MVFAFSAAFVNRITGYHANCISEMVHTTYTVLVQHRLYESAKLTYSCTS